MIEAFFPPSVFFFILLYDGYTISSDRHWLCVCMIVCVEFSPQQSRNGMDTGVSPLWKDKRGRKLNTAIRICNNQFVWMKYLCTHPKASCGFSPVWVLCGMWSRLNRAIIRHTGLLCEHAGEIPKLVREGRVGNAPKSSVIYNLIISLSVQEHRLFLLRVSMVTTKHFPLQILSQIPVRTVIETRFLEDKGAKSERMTVNEIWICNRDQEGFKYKLWIRQKFRAL